MSSIESAKGERRQERFRSERNHHNIAFTSGLEKISSTNDSERVGWEKMG